MLGAFILDMAMLVYIEVTRAAVERAVHDTSTLMRIHIALSVSTIVLYLGQIVTGIRKTRGRPSRWHRLGGPGLLLARFGNLVTSFMI